MPGKLIIGVTCGGSKERFLLIHEGFPRVIDCGREVLVPSFSDERNWMNNCCVSPFPTTFSRCSGYGISCRAAVSNAVVLKRHPGFCL